mmetsp:Transcript_25466/g.58773  ORF Transcript_25466/g.58773 Transcript_25466/m.58773 type:complete len:84 (+) Transcript_25466:685-936(+)
MCPHYYGFWKRHQLAHFCGKLGLIVWEPVVKIAKTAAISKRHNDISSLFMRLSTVDDCRTQCSRSAIGSMIFFPSTVKNQILL